MRWHRRLHARVLEGDQARRVSLLDLDEYDADGTPRSTRQIAVSDSRIFFDRVTYTDSYQTTDPEIAALGYAPDDRLSLIDSLHRDPSALYGTLVARGKRAFVSGNGMMEVITSDNDAPLTATTHDLRSYGCYESSLEVVGDEAYCALGMYGVQTIPLD